MHQEIYMPRTLMQRLSIIAPLVVSILYNSLGQIHAPTTVPNYVLVYIVSSSF